MAELDLSQPSWPYDLAQQFLDAAQCCGFKCERIYVNDGTLVESMPPGCCCMLVASVDVSWEPAGTTTWMLDRPRKVCVVNLTLEQCVLVPDATSAPDPAAVSANARDNITARTRILQGLAQARAEQNLGGEGMTVVPAGFTPVSQNGGVARWLSSWRCTTE